MAAVGNNERIESSEHAVAERKHRRYIEVHSIGEHSIEPDVYEFHMSVQSVKETLVAAKESVKKRVDYALHVLHNLHKIPRTSVETREETTRTELQYCIHCSIHVSWKDIKSLEKARNQIVEKLDSNVKVSQISCANSESAEDSLRLSLIHI